jgi:glucose-1-phosphatase
MIRGLIFDYGGVIQRTHDQAPRRAWEVRLGLPEHGLADLVFDNPIAQQATVGRAETEEIWRYVARRLQLPPADLARLRIDFWRGDQTDRKLLTYLQQERRHRRTALLSNAWPNARQVFLEQPGVRGAFDLMVISAEEGIAKPNPEIFQRTLARLRLEPQQAVFVDDMPQNVQAAEQLGMRGIIFHSADETLGEVARMAGE